MPEEADPAFEFNTPEVWRSEGTNDVYRWIPPGREYAPVAPWPGTGRFDNGETPTLYLSMTADAAVAEYFRRHPELLRFQEGLKIRLFQIHISALGNGLDVSAEDLAKAVGVEWERLRSSDLRRSERYEQCQELAEAVKRADGISIRYPSAALESAVNVVLFGDDQRLWTAEVDSEIDLPLVDPERVHPLPNGAEP